MVSRMLFDGRMHAVAVLTLFSLCVQCLPLVSAEETGSGSGDVLPAADMHVPSAESGSLLPTADTGAVVSPPAELPPPAPDAVLSPLLVRINEVHWAGSDLSTADEWLELTAVPLLTGAVITEVLTLEGWTVTVQKESGEAVIARFDAQHVIASGGYLVVANAGAGATRLRHEPSLVLSSVSLPNTKLLLRLRDAAGALVDEVDDGIGVPFAGLNPSGGTKASMERLDPRLPGAAKENWRTALTAHGLDSGAPLLGTPGYPNGTIEPPDAEPPAAATDLRAYAVSGAVIVLWQPGGSADASRQHLTVLDGEGLITQSLSLPAAATGTVLTGVPPGASVEHRTADDSGNESESIGISVQPLHKPIITELLPDPPGTDDGEWIELRNLGDQPLNLGGWRLSSGSRGYRFPPGSGAVLGPGETRLLPAAETGLALPNAGGEVSLSAFGWMVDRLAYGALPEGVSIGRMDEQAVPVCVPTPGIPNAHRPSGVTMEGFVSEGSDPLTLNLAAVASGGTLAGARCRWDFGDGYVSDSCNPPAHRMKAAGDVPVRLEVQDYCGNTMIHSQNVRVFIKPSAIHAQSSATQHCTRSSTGIELSEFLPSPLTGTDEWIELRHVGGPDITLCGWSVDDQAGGSKAYPLDGRRLGSGDYLLLPREETGLALNNDQDIVRLIAPLPGGGTGVVQALPYYDSVAGQSYALRADGHWLWTPFLSPGASNRFEEADLQPQAPPVELSAALPNPKGDDRYGEWIELRNLTGRPQWLNGWRVRSASGSSLDLTGTVLAKRQRLRVALERKGFTLKNKEDALLLIDPGLQIRSVISWAGSKEAQVVRRPELPTSLMIERAALTEAGKLRGRAVLSAEDKDPPRITVDLLGVRSFWSYLTEYENLLSALIEGKKLELKNDSSNDGSYIAVDGADIAPLVLRAGLAYVPGDQSFERRLEYEAYERDARRNLRGMWASADTFAAIDARRGDELLDERARTHGLQLTVRPASGVVESGTLLDVHPTVPADLSLRRGSGGWQPFTGAYVITDGRYQLRAEYRLRTSSGSSIRSTVTTREYSVRQKRYESCIKVSEVYPSPRRGESEWAELVSTCASAVSLLGWKLDDVYESGSQPQLLGTGTVILPGERLVLSGAALRLALNNGGDGFTVYDPNGRVSDSIWYPSIKQGRAYAVSERSWCVTVSPTPGAENVCTAKVTARRKTAARTARPFIGLGTRYASESTGEELTGSITKGDRRFTLMEGLNANGYEENISPIVLLYLIVLSFVIVVLLMRAR